MAVGFDEACALLETALEGTLRAELVAELSTSPTLERALVRLRDRMRANVWKVGDWHVRLDPLVRDHDARARQDGFHILHDWDGTSDRVTEDIIPVDVLNYLIDRRGADPPDPTALAVLVDYYFFYVLALLTLRVWDEGDPNARLDRVDRLLHALQGEGSGGQGFANDAAMLMLVATSHYELDERGYDRLLDRVRSLGRPQRARIALVHAVTMGCHLRFGFEATYVRDTVKMREDNVADYPWLSFALATLLDEYAHLEETVDAWRRDTVIEGLLNGLSADARAFLGDRPPASLARCEAERAGFRQRFAQHREALLAAFDAYRPSAQAYSPLSFFFNFSHNVLKGMVVHAVLTGTASPLTMNDLLTSHPGPEPNGEGDRDRDGEAKMALARTLMAYARANPDRIRGRLMPVVVYDPQAGRRTYSVMLRKLAG